MDFFERIVSLIAPHNCTLCGLEGSVLCDQCQGRAIRVKRPVCYRCNRLAPFGATCLSCLAVTDLSGVSVAAYYGGAIQELLDLLKYERARSAAVALAVLMEPHLNADDFDVVTAVPADTGYRQRGNHHPELIGRAMARQLGVPYVDTLLRVKAAHQTSSQRGGRLLPIKEAFILHRELFIRDARILLVADVITNGATLAECAAVLKNAGAKRIWGAVAAKR